MTEAEKIMALSEHIGATQPISDDEGNLVGSIASAKVYNPNLNKKKAPVAIDAEFLEKHKEKAQMGKSIIEMAEKIGRQGLDDATLYNEDLESTAVAKNKAVSAINSVIEMFGEDILEYWCPDAETKAACSKLRPILSKIAERVVK